MFSGLSETYETDDALIIPGCSSNSDSGSYGCCLDGVTAATGPNQLGCPSKFIFYSDSDSSSLDYSQYFIGKALEIF